MTGRVLVGIDGSDGSHQAFTWAFEEAALRHCLLEVVSVREPASSSVLHRRPADPDQRAAAASRFLAEAIETADAMQPSDVQVTAIEGDPIDTLCLRAEAADLLVVGSRGHGRVAGLLLGSVSNGCARRSKTPVVIVPPPHGKAPDPIGRTEAAIVAGVDGSVGSNIALRWALEEATLRNARLEVIDVWRADEASDDLGEELAMFPSLSRRDRSLADATQTELDAVISELGPTANTIDIEPLAIEGNPVEVLCERAATADLLVVGSRGRGVAAGLLLGSISAACAHRSTRPVAIIPTAR